MRTKHVVLLIIVCLLAAGLAAFIFFKLYSNKQPAVSQQIVMNSQINNNATSTPKAEEISSWKTYTNKDLRISFEYPIEWGEPIISSEPINPSECEGVIMKTYLPDIYKYTDKITFSKRNHDYYYIGLTRFNQSHPNGCDDSGVINLITEKKKFLSQKIGVIKNDIGIDFEIFKNNQGNLVSFYPNFYDELETGITQLYTFYGPDLLVQGRIDYDPTAADLNESEQYKCKSEEEYGSCGLTKWIKKGKLSVDIRKDLNALDHLIYSFKFIN